MFRCTSRTIVKRSLPTSHSNAPVRHDRPELHTWATFRHRRSLGRAVLDAALTDAPRPLWLNPAISSLREFYLSKGAVPDPGGSRWLVLLEG